MNINPGDIVLEVGSGNNPNPRSDILLDRYLFDNGQRAGEFRIVVDRPLVVGDGYHLPFKNKTFDYVICSHILEHMKDPKKFIGEIMRVGKAGYIEVPSDISERIFGWNFHLWYCSIRGKTLTLKRKKEGEQFGGFFHGLIADQIWFRRFFEEYEEKFYIQYEWGDTIELRVHGAEPSPGDLSRLDSAAWSLVAKAKPDMVKDCMFYVIWMKRRMIRKVKKTVRLCLWSIRRSLFGSTIIGRIMPYLTCPVCRSDNLARSRSKIVCRKCDTVFPLVGVIPIMLSPAERKRGY